MQSGPDDRLMMVRRYYKAYEDDDPKVIEQLLHPQFTFTSPRDDRIDRAAYFERCWPPHERIESITLLDLCADTRGALIRYRATEFAGPGFANVEHFEFAADRISQIEVYFGRDLG
jgi:hypothetical protein